MKEPWQLAAVKLLFGVCLFGAWMYLVISHALAVPKDPTNAEAASLLVLTLQSAYSGLGFVHLKGAPTDFKVDMVKAAAAACILIGIAILVYTGLTQMAVLVADIGVALTALGIVNKPVSDPKSGEAK